MDRHLPTVKELIDIQPDSREETLAFMVAMEKEAERIGPDRNWFYRVYLNADQQYKRKKRMMMYELKKGGSTAASALITANALCIEERELMVQAECVYKLYDDEYFRLKAKGLIL